MLTLSQPELRRLTGERTIATQVTWLSKAGIPFRIDHHGRLIVTSDHVAKWVCGAQLRPASVPRMDLVR